MLQISKLSKAFLIYKSTLAILSKKNPKKTNNVRNGCDNPSSSPCMGEYD